MADTQYVIVGGGLAAASAIEGIRELDPKGPITMISAERELPYHRPPLSKTFLAGKDGVETVRVHDVGWYRDQKVKVRLGQMAKSVHMGRQTVAMQSGERVAYDRLLIATGASPRRAQLPGGDSHGILYLRTLDDSFALKRALTRDAKLVIVGGGFIGVEVAATARYLGVDVTLLEARPVLYGAFASPELSAFYRRVLEHQGVKVLTGTKVARFVASEGKLSAVATEDGKQIPATIALIGVGAEPNTAWLASSGFQIDRSALIVNVRLETPNKNIFAAGDVTRFPDPVTHQPRRLEHWGNALAQGKQAGRNMAGANEPFMAQAAFFSDIVDLTTNVLGDTDNPSRVEIRGTMEQSHPKFTALYQRGDRLTGAVMVNPNTDDRSAEFDMLQKNIAAGTMPPA